MRKIFIVLMVIMVGAFSAYAETTTPDEKKDEKPIVQQCPKTKMTESCLACHVTPTFALKEAKPDATRDYPNWSTIVIDNVAHLLITDVDDGQAVEFFRYVSWHPEIKHIVIELFSPGGSMFKAWRIVNYMQMYKERGYLVETRCYGFAASAGFLIFINGTKDYRFASETAEMMWHELISFKLFDISSPSDKEDEANVLRHLQTTATNYLSERSNISADEWNEHVHKKEFWLRGKQAIKYGVADGVPK